jgi:maleylpyruvate isomerase
MKLYGYWRSSSSWRVRIALIHKGLSYEYVAVNLLDGAQAGAEHRVRNPLAQVPVLELEDGSTISQSMAILEYLEETSPEPRLLPPDTLGRAHARQIAEMVNAGTQPLQNLKVLNAIEAGGGDKIEWAARWVAEGLTAIEECAKSVAGRFCVGDQVSVADLYVVPQLYNARRFGVDLAPFAELTRIEAACTELPAFLAAHPDRQPDAKTP